MNQKQIDYWNLLRAANSNDANAYQNVVDRNAAAESAGVLGSKNRMIPMDNADTQWYPAQLMSMMEPAKWEAAKKLLQSPQNDNPPNFRN